MCSGRFESYRGELFCNENPIHCQLKGDVVLTAEHWSVVARFTAALVRAISTTKTPCVAAAWFGRSEWSQRSGGPWRRARSRSFQDGDPFPGRRGGNRPSHGLEGRVNRSWLPQGAFRGLNVAT